MVATASIFGFPCAGAGAVISATASPDQQHKAPIVGDVCSLVMLFTPQGGAAAVRPDQAADRSDHDRQHIKRARDQDDGGARGQVGVVGQHKPGIA